jgi:hypothetical protein
VQAGGRRRLPAPCSPTDPNCLNPQTQSIWNPKAFQELSAAARLDADGAAAAGGGPAAFAREAPQQHWDAALAAAELSRMQVRPGYRHGSWPGHGH